MKILHVIPAVAPRYGGPSQAVIEMCLALQRTGFDVRRSQIFANRSQRHQMDDTANRAVLLA